MRSRRKRNVVGNGPKLGISFGAQTGSRESIGSLRDLSRICGFQRGAVKRCATQNLIRTRALDRSGGLGGALQFLNRVTVTSVTLGWNLAGVSGVYICGVGRGLLVGLVGSGSMGQILAKGCGRNAPIMEVTP